MLDTLITSRTRLRLIIKFFLNPSLSSYLRELADEFGESTNAVRVELNRLSEAGLLESEGKGNVVLYRARQSHPLFPELHNIVSKFIGINRIVEDVIENLGNLEKAWLVGDYAAGKDSGVIDILLEGEVNKTYLDELVKKAEPLIQRRVRSLVMRHEECEDYLKNRYDGPRLLLWE